MYNIQKEGLFGKELPRLSNIHVTSSSTNQQSSKKEAASKPAPRPAPNPKAEPNKPAIGSNKIGVNVTYNRIQITVE